MLMISKYIFREETVMSGIVILRCVSVNKSNDHDPVFCLNYSSVSYVRVEDGV